MRKVFTSGALNGVRVTITAGPTREAIDPVRYISNHSSGKMGYALARAAVEAGAVVTLISGPVNLPVPERVNVVKVETAQDMLKACEQQPCDVFVGVAAVADYRAAAPAAQKIKKDAGELSLPLVRNPDILAAMAVRKPRPFCAGFAAETENLAANAQGKLAAKNLDLIFANDASSTFGQDEATVTAYWKGGEQLFPHGSKEQLARQMVALIAARLPGKA
jgi:phosphopantothenoylcysteine decarboxylase/phosphopantothenate--cysteine ligase